MSYNQQEEYAIIGHGWLGKPLKKALQLMSNAIVTSTRSALPSDGKSEQDEKNLQFDASNFSYFPAILAAKTVIILIPPSAANSTQSYSNAIKNIVDNCLKLGTEKIIFSSSTGVYSNESGNYSEQSHLSNSDRSKELIEAEKSILECSSGLVIRFGGLINEKRNPSSYGRESKLPGNEPINMIHQTDAVKAIIHLVNSNAKGIYNAVAPEHPFREEFYNSAFRQNKLGEIHLLNSPSPVLRIINCEKLLESGYSFTYPNPLKFPMQQENK